MKIKPVDILLGSRRLGRGIVPSSSLILIGPTGIGKTTFCKQFMYNGLIKGNPGIYVTTDESPNEIENSMHNLGFAVKPYIDKSMLRIVDCYSFKVGGRSSSEYVVNSQHNYIDEVSKNIENARENLLNVHLVFDSLTDPTTKCNQDAVFIFLQNLVARIRSMNGKAIFTVTSGILNEYSMNLLRRNFDGILEMRMDETGKAFKRLFRIFSLKGADPETSWTPFKITNQGFVMKREKELKCVFCNKIIDWEPISETIDGKNYDFDTIECINRYKKFKILYEKHYE
jgi:KaiC/GvpD/RAD55 family RecA-like ATPase